MIQHLVKSIIIRRIHKLFFVYLLEVKLNETPLLFQSVSVTSTKEPNENEIPSLNPNKRPHSEEISEVVNTTESSNEQLSPLKRARRSISSQESVEAGYDIIIFIKHINSFILCFI